MTWSSEIFDREEKAFFSNYDGINTIKGSEELTDKIMNALKKDGIKRIGISLLLAGASLGLSLLIHDKTLKSLPQVASMISFLYSVYVSYGLGSIIADRNRIADSYIDDLRKLSLKKFKS